jgi:hypothetical protein
LPPCAGGFSFWRPGEIKMSDKMLDILYKKVFEKKAKAEALSCVQGEVADRQRGIAIEKNQLLCELIDIRTEQLKQE